MSATTVLIERKKSTQISIDDITNCLCFLLHSESPLHRKLSKLDSKSKNYIHEHKNNDQKWDQYKTFWKKQTKRWKQSEKWEETEKRKLKLYSLDEIRSSINMTINNPFEHRPKTEDDMKQWLEALYDHKEMEYDSQNELNTKPMNEWKWYHIVDWIDKITNIKHFSSVFYEYKMNGDQLSSMNKDEIKLLIECGPQYIKMNKEKNIQIFIEEIKKCMFQSCIMSNYYQTMCQLKYSGNKAYDIIEALRPIHNGEGPKALWKLNTFYFSEIDNYLALFTAPTECRDAFCDIFPLYLKPKKKSDDSDIHSDILNDNDEKEGIITNGQTDIITDVNIPALNQLHFELSHFVSDIDDDDKESGCYVLMALLFGCLFPYIYISRRGINEAHTIMELTVDSVAKRTIELMEYEFFIPQMILNIAITGLYTADITIDPNDYIDNAQFDRYYVQYNHYKTSSESIHSLYLYETLGDTMIGSSELDGNITINIFNGSCAIKYEYDQELEKRSASPIKTDCDSSPSRRPWFDKAQQLHLGEIGWTEPYLFTNHEVGITCIHKLEFNGVQVIFLAEFTVHTLPHIFESIVHVPEGVTFLATPNGSVIASDIDQIDIYPPINECMYCIAKDSLLLKSLRKLRMNDYNHENKTVIKTDEFTLELYPFKATYLTGNIEYGTIGIVYDNYKYLSKIKSAGIWSWVLFTMFTIALLAHIGIVPKILQKLRYAADRSMSTLTHKPLAVSPQKSQSYSVAPENSQMDLHRPLKMVKDWRNTYLKLIAWLCQCQWFLMLLYLLILFQIWTKSVDSTLDNVTDLYLNEEYMVVQDGTLNILQTAQSIADVIDERFNRNDMESTYIINDTFIDTVDTFFCSLMMSFKERDNTFISDLIYLATPDGKMIGCAHHNQGELRIKRLDASTDWEYTENAVDDTLQRNGTVYKASQDYDPRCRPWYKQAIGSMVSGSISDGFGDIQTLLDFYESQSIARENQACQEAIEFYLDLWNITGDTLIKTELNPLQNTQNKIYKSNNNTVYELIWSQYIFASAATSGLTATKPIIDKTTGAVLGVVGIDFILTNFGNYLAQFKDETWIFDANNAEMVASSFGNVTEPSDAEECVQIAGVLVDCVDPSQITPYLANEHPNDLVRVISQEIIEFYNDSLPINASKAQDIDLPIDYPYAMSGKVLSYPYIGHHDENGLNWVIAKVIDISEYETQEHDDVKILGFLFTMTFFLMMVCLQRINKRKKSAKHKKPKPQKNEDRRVKIEQLQLVKKSTRKDWKKWLNKHQFDNPEHVVTTQDAVAFMSQKASQHIKSAECKESALLKCVFQIHMDDLEIRALINVIKYWNTYNVAIVIMFLHLLMIIYLPETPTVLKKEGFIKTSSKIAKHTIPIFISFEVIDIIFQFISRFIEFDALKQENLLIMMTQLNFGSKHKSVAEMDAFVRESESDNGSWYILSYIKAMWHYFGSLKSGFYLIQFILVILIMIDAVFTFNQIPFIGYYIPLVAVLLIIRSDTLLQFTKRFFRAIISAKDVFFSYFILIFIVSVLAMSGFSDILNPDEPVDTFHSSIRALITSFVFISTGENYNEIVYTALGDSKNDTFWLNNVEHTVAFVNLVFFAMVSIVGLYFFIPVIIHRFETAFDKEQNKLHSKDKVKLNSIIAAYIMCDMNDNGNISLQEFSGLMRSSTIPGDALFKEFATALDQTSHNIDTEEDEISLDEFVKMFTERKSITELLNIKSNPKVIKCKCKYENITNIFSAITKHQSFLECNIFRARSNRFYVLILVLMPSVCCSLLYGLVSTDNNVLEALHHVLFFINFVDINLRWYAFGWKRFFKLMEYSDPPFVEYALFKYKYKQKQVFKSAKTIKLSRRERKWADTYLSSDYVCLNKYFCKEIEAISSLKKVHLSSIHNAEWCFIYIGFIGFLISYILPNSFGGYKYVFLQFHLFRLFTLIESNQKVIARIFHIVPKFVDLLAFTFIFIFIWSRIGCTLFGDKTDHVLPDVYEIGAEANFDSMGSSILTLMQLMIGEGWHEIMYLNIIGTRIEYSIYFIIYIVIVTLIVSNIFVGLFLAEIDDINKQEEANKEIDDMIADQDPSQTANDDNKGVMLQIQNNDDDDIQNTESDTEPSIHLEFETADQQLKNYVSNVEQRIRINCDDDDDGERLQTEITVLEVAINHLKKIQDDLKELRHGKSKGDYNYANGINGNVIEEEQSYID